jgi:hypothetical protein
MNGVHLIKAGAVLLILLLSSVSSGAEPDFYIDYLSRALRCGQGEL